MREPSFSLVDFFMRAKTLDLFRLKIRLINNLIIIYNLLEKIGIHWERFAPPEPPLFLIGICSEDGKKSNSQSLVKQHFMVFFRVNLNIVLLVTSSKFEIRIRIPMLSEVL